MVRLARLELAQVSLPPPQDGVSTNSTTTAYYRIHKIIDSIFICCYAAICSKGL